MVRVFFLVIVLTAQFLNAGIEKYFKIAKDKSGFHQMRSIDFIYMINLDQRPEKFASCLQQLEPWGIHPYRFSAVNGWELTYSALAAVGVVYQPWMIQDLWGTCYLEENGWQPFHEIMKVPGRTYFSHCMARGTVGIVLSHLSVLQDAFDSGYETIWVMEDDIESVRDPNLISDLVEALDALVGREEWDILFTDPDTKNQAGQYVPCTAFARSPHYSPNDPSRFYQRRTISSDFQKVGARYGAYSMIVRRSGMKKILDFFKKYQIFLPFDMSYTLPDDIRLYSLNYDLVSTQPRAPTDNGSPGYQKKEF